MPLFVRCTCGRAPGEGGRESGNWLWERFYLGLGAFELTQDILFYEQGDISSLVAPQVGHRFPELVYYFQFISNRVLFPYIYFHNSYKGGSALGDIDWQGTVPH